MMSFLTYITGIFMNFELCFGHLKKFLFLVMAAILDKRRCWQTQFWNGTTQGSFQQSLVEIGSVVSEERILISSNGQNCSILGQKVPKFELYKHNDELFNIHYGIFYELWTFAYFDRLCKLEKRGNVCSITSLLISFGGLLFFRPSLIAVFVEW
jgi:hypothetical protein